jgi:WD40 repeat protein
MSRIYTYISILVLSFVPILSSFAQDNTQAGLPEGAIARLGKGGINIMRFSPDGTHLAVGTDVGVWLYDVPDGKETALFTGHTGHVNALAFSPDGKVLASGGFNNPIIQIWDIKTKSKLASITLAQFPNVLSTLIFHGRTLISINRGSEITYWNANTGEKISGVRLNDSHDKVVFSQDGTTLAASGKVGRIHLWDVTTNSQLGSLQGHARGRNTDIHSLAFSSDKKLLASGSEDKTVILWDTQNHKKLATLKGHPGWVTVVAFSEDRETFASGDAATVIKLWDLNRKKERATITGHKNTINALTFAPIETPIYGACLASGSADGTIRFWNPENGEELTTFAAGHTEWIKAVAFSENGSTLASAAFNGTVDVWSLKTWQELTNFTDGHSKTTETVVLSPNAKIFACRGSGGMTAFNPLGFGFRSGGGNGNIGIETLQLWDIMTGEILSSPWQEGLHWPSTVAFSPNNNIIAITSRQEIQAWHLNTGIELFQLETKQPSFRERLVFSPDGKKLAAINPHHNPQVWDISTQRDITPPNIKKTSVLAFSPDSSTLATVSSEGIHLWKLSTEIDNKHTLIPGRLDGFSNELIFSPDGTILIGSGMDFWSTSIKLWDVETGISLGNLSGHTETVETLVFSQDGKMLASGSHDGTVLLWDWEEIISKAKENKGNKP